MRSHRGPRGPRSTEQGRRTVSWMSRFLPFGSPPRDGVGVDRRHRQRDRRQQDRRHLDRPQLVLYCTFGSQRMASCISGDAVHASATGGHRGRIATAEKHRTSIVASDGLAGTAASSRVWCRRTSCNGKRRSRATDGARSSTERPHTPWPKMKKAADGDDGRVRSQPFECRLEPPSRKK